MRKIAETFKKMITIIHENGSGSGASSEKHPTVSEIGSEAESREG
jgi:hypothetical protein